MVWPVKRGFPPPLKVAPWADDDFPHGQTCDLNEYPHKVLAMKVCRSFRADLRHKLEILLRAHGGYGRGGLYRAAYCLNVRPRTFASWLHWRAMPKTTAMLERLDERYVEALEILAKRQCQKKPRRRAAKPLETVDALSP